MPTRSIESQPQFRTVPILSRDIVQLFPVSEDSVDPLAEARIQLFKNPKFQIVLPNLGVYAVEHFGLELASRKIDELALELPIVRPFNIARVDIEKNGSSYGVILRGDTSTILSLNDEREKARLALDNTTGINSFHGMTIANIRGAEQAVEIVGLIDSYLSADPTHVTFDLHKPTRYDKQFKI